MTQMGTLNSTGGIKSNIVTEIYIKYSMKQRKTHIWENKEKHIFGKASASAPKCFSKLGAPYFIGCYTWYK